MAAAVTEAAQGARPEDVAGMQAALDLASKAYACGEVPVGAVVVRNGLVVGRGFNQPIGNGPPANLPGPPGLTGPAPPA